MLRPLLRARADRRDAHAFALTGSFASLGGVLSGPLPPALTLNVRDARGTAPSASVTVTNLSLPIKTPAAAASCSAQSSTTTTCSIDAHAAGRYEADASAPGYVGQHVSANVPAPTTAPGACCGVPYVPVQVKVLLTAGPSRCG